MLNFSKLESISELDDLIYQNEECFNFKMEDIKSIKEKMIVSSFAYHYENCEDYRNYCKSLGVTPDDIAKDSNIKRIPLITSTLFKELPIRTCKEDEVVKKCISSGTKGSTSTVYRDETTLNRFLGSVQITMDQILNIDDTYCINLGPSTEEAGDLWFSYTMSTLDMLYPTKNMVIDDNFSPDKTVELINEVKDSYENIIIIGAPIMFLELLQYMENEDIKIKECSNIFFITAGGWKRFSGQAIPRTEFREKIQTFFINSKNENFRDVLNLVELNSILPECEHQVKHIVPWLDVFILDPVKMEPLPDGEAGLIAFLDPTSTSYPCFILTDDIGRISLNGKCKCGRNGLGLEYIKRVKSPESRGCALKIDKKYAKKV